MWKIPFCLEYEYIRVYEEVVRWRTRDKDAFRALFIGGGGYTFPRFLDAKHTQAIMDVVEIDPEVTRVSQNYFGLSETKRVRSFNQDARWFVMNCREKASYDFIFGDAFNDLSVPYPPHHSGANFIWIKMLFKQNQNVPLTAT